MNFSKTATFILKFFFFLGFIATGCSNNTNETIIPLPKPVHLAEIVNLNITIMSMITNSHLPDATVTFTTAALYNVDRSLKTDSNGRVYAGILTDNPVVINIEAKNHETISRTYIHESSMKNVDLVIYLPPNIVPE